jgi:N-acetylglucosaminyldiphosphoundecaprenol N-acetyl-beta-D-mannosaminyltransferase
MKCTDLDKIDILGVILNRISYDEAIERIKDYIKTKRAGIIVTPNAEIIMNAQTRKELKNAINTADISFPDGIGVLIASKILKSPLADRTAGYDLLIKMLQLAQEERLSIYLLGGVPGVAEDAARILSRKFPNLITAGTMHGYFDEDAEKRVIEDINKKTPDMLIVGMGSPKQELFMSRFRHVLKCGVAIGVGGSLDVISGRVQRAPVFMQKAGMEWLFRLLVQPARIKRVGALPLFLLKVIFSGESKNDV